MKKLFIGAFLFILSFPVFAQASVGVGFGGYVTGVVPCTCSGGSIITYKRFYAQNPVPVVASLYASFPPLTIPFSYYLIGVPTTWEVGVFTPSPGLVGECLVGVIPYCTPVPIPVLGIIQYAGTSPILSNPL